MINLEALNELANKLSQTLPTSLKDDKENLKENFKMILQASFAKLDLVTREEFDKQTALLAKAREKLNQLEKQMTANKK